MCEEGIAMKISRIENKDFTEFIKKRLHKLYRGRIVSFTCPVWANCYCSLQYL